MFKSLSWHCLFFIVWALPAIWSWRMPAVHWRTHVSISRLWGGACPRWWQQESGVWQADGLWLCLLQELQGVLSRGFVSNTKYPSNRWRFTGKLTNHSLWSLYSLTRVNKFTQLLLLCSGFFGEWGGMSTGEVGASLSSPYQGVDQTLPQVFSSCGAQW